jgi:hypothetical protein
VVLLLLIVFVFGRLTFKMSRALGGQDRTDHQARRLHFVVSRFVI